MRLHCFKIASEHISKVLPSSCVMFHLACDAARSFFLAYTYIRMTNKIFSRDNGIVYVYHQHTLVVIPWQKISLNNKNQ